MQTKPAGASPLDETVINNDVEMASIRLRNGKWQAWVMTRLAGAWPLKGLGGWWPCTGEPIAALAAIERASL